MDEELSKKILKYETFLNDRLKTDLRKAYEERDKIYDKISQYEKLITVLGKISENHDLEKPLKTQIDIGCNFYVQATVPNSKLITVNIGYGLYLEMTHSEATDFSEKKIAELNKYADKYSEQAIQIKARIKIVLEGLRELQGIEPESVHRNVNL